VVIFRDFENYAELDAQTTINSNQNASNNIGIAAKVITHILKKLRHKKLRQL